MELLQYIDKNTSKVTRIDGLYYLEQFKTAYVRGHRRTPSDVQFKELTRRDIMKAMNKEVAKLVNTALPGQQKEMRRELDDYEELFNRYLQETGPSFAWERIKVLPDDA
ncbi:UTP--glucose-1-phosphate uridylyltransferase-like, partial [Mizuhopecten yessoensis]|uniref:UTP--glucose-1-phosphate uridylyltransferase-like n=1 Tax=Mizuhopecten yessoensis TaxID=6573 RepID=UPI000B45CD54